MSDKEDPRVTKLKHLRRGKKASITKRLDTIKRILSEGGSRVKLKFLMSAAYDVLRAVTADCTELFKLMEKFPSFQNQKIFWL